MIASFSTGLITGLGAAQLKAATNAPGLKPDRQSGMFTYGAVILVGFNNINIGYAIGKDNVFGSAGQYWVYQHKTWQGIILSLDVLKF
ncbi:MAG: hypothetical protein V4456_11040 [Bacteroidota bacterium]